jgi:hypothetical protein
VNVTKTTKRPEQDGSFELTRLEDIDPEFVSLVPRGANKHSKMLVVKADPAAALAAFRAAPGDPALYAHLVHAALAAGQVVAFDPADALDATLPAALQAQLKGDAGAPPAAAPAPAAPSFPDWLAAAQGRVATRMVEAILAQPAAEEAPPVAKSAPPAPVDPRLEIAKAEAARLRAEVSRLRAAIGSAAALPAGEVAAAGTLKPASTLSPWTADFAALVAAEEK